MLGFDLDALTPGELRAYGIGYADALDDLRDQNRRTAEAFAVLEAELEEARRDADYWRRVANPVEVADGPSYAELERIRHEQMTEQAEHPAEPWHDVPTREPGAAES